tara:strand:- start:196 stop:657 length:462 start_codon:yes stop_codon:yes gene_type:complete
MSLHEKIKSAGLSGDHKVVLKYKDGADVVHAWDGYEEEVLEETNFANEIANLIAHPGFKNNVIQELRDDDLLEDYPRDYSGFAEFVGDVIKENFWDMEFIERYTERYDYKRGFFNLEAIVNTTVGDVLSTPEYAFGGWTATVKTDVGVLNITN